MGKYSHTMVPFFYRHDVPVCGRPEKGTNGAPPGLLSPVDCASKSDDPLIRRPDGDKKGGARVPTLYFIGGDLCGNQPVCRAHPTWGHPRRWHAVLAAAARNRQHPLRWRGGQHGDSKHAIKF